MHGRIRHSFNAAVLPTTSVPAEIRTHITVGDMLRSRKMLLYTFVMCSLWYSKSITVKCFAVCEFVPVAFHRTSDNSFFLLSTIPCLQVSPISGLLTAYISASLTSSTRSTQYPASYMYGPTARKTLSLTDAWLNIYCPMILRFTFVLFLVLFSIVLYVCRA